MTALILGVDPGAKGALALLDVGGLRVGDRTTILDVLYKVGKR